MSTQTIELVATTRSDMGKGASRRLRREQGLVPGIIYGGSKDAVPFSMEHRIIAKALESESVYSSILELKIDGKKEKVVLKDLQRHPYKPRVQHIDFQRVSATQKITMQVPLHFLNEDTAPGVKAGGVVSHHMTEVEVRCLAKDLPEYIEIDLGACELDTIIHISDLKVSDSVELTAISHGHDNDQPVASIHMPRRVELTASASAESAEGSAGAESSGSGEASNNG